MTGKPFLAGVALLAALLAATWSGLRPPEPLPAAAPPGAFSAGRALPWLERILAAAGRGEPHPAGSPAGARVRATVVEALRDLGAEPRIVESTTCNRYLTCTPVSNVVARIPGRGPGRAVLVSAHHDSVPAGPGAADDASGVAIVLELARALRVEPAATDVLLLVDDAEESGLGGAEAFLRTPDARDVGAVVNLEARGTGGPSLLFETAGSGAQVARALAGAPRPVGGSLLATVYRLIPNDTNLTVLRRLGVPGANLAFIEGAVRYHTPRDDLAHLDARSVQHQGETALALVRGLAGGAGTEAEAVWFDLLGRAVVRWPQSAAVPLALLALVLSLAAAARAVREGRTGAGRIALGSLVLPISLAVAAPLGLVASRALGLDPLQRPWIAHPAPLVAAFVAAGLLGAAVATLWPAHRAGTEGVRHGVRLLLALLGVVLAARLPGASHLLLAPVLPGALVAVVAGRRGTGAAEDLVTLVAGGLVLLPPLWMLEPALGHLAGPAVAAVLALASLPLVPLAASFPARIRLLLAAAPALAGAGALTLAAALPVASVDAPEKLVLYFHQDEDTGVARVLASSDVGRLPPEVRAAAPFSTAAAVRLPWGALRPAFEAKAAPLPLPGPTVEVLEVRPEAGGLRWRARLSSPRGATELQLVLPPDARVEEVTLDGMALPAPVPKLARWYGGWRVLRFPARPEGIEVSLRAGPGPVDVVVADQSPGLPPGSAAIAAARPAAVVTQQEGDVTLFTRRVRISANPAPVR